MTRIVFSTLLFTALATACTDEAEPTAVETVVTADAIGDERLRIDLSRGRYRFDASAGAIDTSLVDVVTTDGNVQSLDSLIDQQFAAVARQQLAKGFTLDEVEGTAKLYMLESMEWIYTTSSYDSTWWRSPQRNCTGGRTLYGMGVRLPPAFGSTGSVLFRGMIPFGPASSPYGTMAAGQESYWGLAENWDMTTYAVCGQRLGHNVKSATSSSNTTEIKSVSVFCPPNTRVIGSGGTITGGDGRVKVDEIRPDPTLTAVTVYASKETVGSSGSWSVTAYAICSSNFTWPTTIQRIATSAPPLSAQYSDLIAECPVGWKLLSSAGGFQVNNPRVTRVMQIIPSVDLRYTIVRGTSRGDTTGLTGLLNAYAICGKESY